MDDAVVVRGLQRRGNLDGDCYRFGNRDRTATDVDGQVLALDQFHDERGDPAALLDAVDVGDVRMVQRRQRLCFTLEAGEPVGVAGERLRQNLERDFPAQSGVGRAIHLSHAAFAQLVEHAKRADGLTNHRTHDGATARPSP